MSLVCASFGLLLIDQPHRAIGAPFLYATDYASETHLLQTGRMFWEACRKMYGYNPWFMAGYPYADYTSGLMWKLLGVVFASFNPGTIAAMFLAAALGFFPFAGYFSVRISGRTAPEALTGAFLFSCFGMLGPPLFFAWMGLLEAVTALWAVTLSAMCLFAWHSKGRAYTWFALLFSTTFALMSHKTAMIALAITGLSALLFSRASLSRLALSALAGLLALAANLFWLWPLYRNRIYFDFEPHYHWGGRNGVIADFFHLDGTLGSTLLAWTIIIASIAGLRILRRSDKSTSDTLTAAAVVLALFAIVGPYIDALAPAQPRRFVGYFLILCIYPASIALHGLLDSIRPRARWSTIVIFTAFILVLPNAYRRVSPFKIQTSLPPRARAVVEWISQNTTPDARVMVEEIGESGGPDNPYGGSYLNNLLPSLTKREIIGGPYPGIDILHHRVTFLDGKVRDKPLAKMSDAELVSLFDTYNIGWVVSFTDEAKKRLEKMDSFIDKAANYGLISCYNVKRKHSYLIGAQGDVKAGPSVIEVKIDRADSDIFAIKYHWDPRFKPDGPVKLDRYEVDGDPVGFIEVRATAPVKFTINYE